MFLLDMAQLIDCSSDVLASRIQGQKTCFVVVFLQQVSDRCKFLPKTRTVGSFLTGE